MWIILPVDFDLYHWLNLCSIYNRVLSPRASVGPSRILRVSSQLRRHGYFPYDVLREWVYDIWVERYRVIRVRSGSGVVDIELLVVLVGYQNSNWRWKYNKTTRWLYLQFRFPLCLLSINGITSNAFQKWTPGTEGRWQDLNPRRLSLQHL